MSDCREMRKGWKEEWGHSVERPTSSLSLGDTAFDIQTSPLSPFFVLVEQFCPKGEPYWTARINADIAGLNGESEVQLQEAIEDSILRAAEQIQKMREGARDGE